MRGELLLAQVLLVGRPAVQRARAASRELRKTPCYDQCRSV